MSKAKELLDAIKKLVFDMPAPVADAVVVKTADGIELSITKMEVGGTVTINGVAAPANTYTLEDGSSITTDAMGAITAVTPVPAPAAPAAAAAAPTATPPATPVTPPAPAAMSAEPAAPAEPKKIVFTEEMKTPEGLDKMFAEFATGTPEERIANLELVAKALMEYSFGWEIRQAKEKADRDAAIKVYTDSLTATQSQVQQQSEIMKQMVALVEQIAGAATTEPPAQTKKQFSFSQVEAKNKSLARFQAAAKKIAEESKATQPTN